MSLTPEFALAHTRAWVDRVVHDTAGHARLALGADEFLFQYALPNFFFHTSAAYHILRQRGLAVGKATFDGFHVYD